MKKHRLKKPSKNYPPGTCFETQNPLKLTSERPKIAKIASKVEKGHAKVHAFWVHASNLQKARKKNEIVRQSGGMRGVSGR